MLKLYNSLTRIKEPFTTLNDKAVTMYVCGITPYDTTHLGHAFTYISFDLLVRYLTYKNYNVIYTQNVTDINDRDNDILKRAKEQHTSWQELGLYWTKRFLDDMQNLNWIMPTNYLKASEHIPHMVRLVQRILEAGYAYQRNGSVYLDTTKISDFGKLSKLSKEEMLKIAESFEEDTQNPDKKHPLDITLWRGSTPNQPAHIPSFPSVFGQGRPGWHIECSAMSMETLGEQIDIHGGGIDLAYPHHEGEIAQSESATLKKPFANYWLHTGAVSYQGNKMSKSLGNVVMVSDLLQKYSPNAIRYLLLSHHYRSSWEFKEEDLQQAQEKVKRIEQMLSENIREEENISGMKQIETFLDDDLNTPFVLLHIDSLLGIYKKTKDQKALQTIKKGFSLLGFI